MATRVTVAKKKIAIAKKSAVREPVGRGWAKPTTPHATPPPKLSKARLAQLVEDATVDAYGESEQAVGFLTMIEDHVEVPFAAEVLGVAVRVTRFEVSDAEEIMAICRRGAHTQRIRVVDLRLPNPPPEGFEWIEAYRFFKTGS